MRTCACVCLCVCVCIYGHAPIHLCVHARALRVCALCVCACVSPLVHVCVRASVFLHVCVQEWGEALKAVVSRGCECFPAGLGVDSRHGTAP